MADSAEKKRLENLKKLNNENRNSRQEIEHKQRMSETYPSTFQTLDHSFKRNYVINDAEKKRANERTKIASENASLRRRNEAVEGYRSSNPTALDNNEDLRGAFIGPKKNQISHGSFAMEALGAQGIYDRRNRDWYNKFSRIRPIDPFNTMSLTKEYLFFTKPDLHIINPNTGDIAKCVASSSFMQDAVDRYRPVCEQLELSASYYSSPANPFATLLSNSVISHLQVPDASEENGNETGANTWGTKITYRGTSYASDQDQSFSLEFEDTKYIEVFMFFKIYDEYCKMKNLGAFELDYADPENARWVNYTVNKILHDQFSIYKFIVGENGQDIIYWGKYTGVYPKGVPRDTFSEIAGNIQPLTFSVDFKAQFYRDMDPYILYEFNRLALGSSYYQNSDILPLFNTDTQQFEGRWSSMPFVAYYPNSSMSAYDDPVRICKYKLLWKE